MQDDEPTLVARRSGPKETFITVLRVSIGGDVLGCCAVRREQTVVLGRDPGCDCGVEHTTVSRRHAAVTEDASVRLVIRDLDSTNGVRVNGQAMAHGTLGVGDAVALGEVRLRVDRMIQGELDAFAEVARQLREASVDPLTGLMTRRQVDRRLSSMAHEGRRCGRTVCALFIDVDRFKEVNDRLGHALGDEVLSAIGRIFRNTLRERDLCARYGGEEFLAVLPACDLEGGILSGARLRNAVEEHPWHQYAPNLVITISAGVAEWRPNEDVAMWLARADGALYRAKRGGRNRVVGGS